MKFGIDIAGYGRLAARRGRGDMAWVGSPLLLVHGAGGAARNFATMLRYLPERVVAIDMPGHGGSAGAAVASVCEAGEVLAAAAAALWPQTPYVVAGHSLGGAQAMAAAAHCERVCAVVGLGVGHEMTFAGRWARVAAASFERFLATMVAAGIPAATIGQLRETGAQTLVRDLQAAAACSPLELAVAVHQRVLLIAGEADAIAPLSSVQTLARAMARAEVVSLPEVGHLPMIEQPQVVAETIERFVVRTCKLSVADRDRPGDEGHAQRSLVR